MFESEVLFAVISYLLAIGLGLGCGSYATMPYYRLPKGEACAGKWIGEKSHCVKCNAQLRTRDLVPVFNWLGTMGKCYNCGVKINPVYFFIELSAAILSVLAFHVFGWDQLYIITLALFTCLVVVSASDFSFKHIDDKVLIPILMLTMLYRALLDGEIYGIIHSLALCVFLCLFFAEIYKKLQKKQFVDYKYLKFFCVCGVAFGLVEVGIFASSILVLLAILKILGKNWPTLAISLSFICLILS